MDLGVTAKVDEYGRLLIQGFIMIVSIINLSLLHFEYIKAIIQLDIS